MLKDINFEIEGQRAICSEFAKIIPLIEKHFAKLDGERAILACGSRSAKFSRACAAFREACQEVTQARVIISDAAGRSVWLKIDIALPDPRPGTAGCVYFEHSVCIGTICAFPAPYLNPKWMNFKYEFKADESWTHVSEILSIEELHLAFYRKQIKDLKAQIEAAKASVPYAFRDCIAEDR